MVSSDLQDEINFNDFGYPLISYRVDRHMCLACEYGWGLYGAQVWSRTEPHSNLRRQFWQQDPEKWQEAKEHGDEAKNN